MGTQIFDNVANAEDVGFILSSGILSSAAPTPSVTTPIFVVDATPAGPLSYPFLLTVASQSETESSAVEIFRIVSGDIGGNVFQCSDRALNGTVAQTWSPGDFAEIRQNALLIVELQNAVEDLQAAVDASNVYGYLNLRY